MSSAIMIIIVAACGAAHSGGSGCGIAIDAVEFQSFEACQDAMDALFHIPPDATWKQKEKMWQPKREIKCVLSGEAETALREEP